MKRDFDAPIFLAFAGDRYYALLRFYEVRFYLYFIVNAVRWCLIPIFAYYVPRSESLGITFRNQVN